VLDGDTGNPVSGALVGVKGKTSAERIYCNLPGGGIHTWTDRSGFFQLEGLQTVPVTIVAAHPDYAQASVSTRSGDESAKVFLKKGRTVTGIVRDDSGQPVSGIAVCVRGGNDYLSWPALTGPDGRYELKIAPDDRRSLGLMAYIPPGGDDIYCQERIEEVGFTPETRVLRAMPEGGEFLNVDFGPSPEHVTWSGTLRDGSGDPIPGGMIYLTPLSGPGSPRSTVCDESGRFELRKLFRDQPYLVSMILPGARSEIALNGLSIDGGLPRVIDRDLQVEPGTISGTIHGDRAGAPLVSGILEARPVAEPNTVSSRCIVDDGGGFTLLGLAEGAYRLYWNDHALLDGEDLFRSEPVAIGNSGTTEITLAKGQVIRNLEVAAAVKGFVHLSGSGFRPEDMNQLELRFENAEETSLGRSRAPLRIRRGYRADGSLFYPVALAPGIWDAGLSLGPSGRRSIHRIRVAAGEATDLFVRREDLVERKGSTAVAGTVLKSDGTPVTGLSVRFSRIVPNGNHAVIEYWESVTDSNGRYSREGLTSGTWNVTTLSTVPMGEFYPSVKIYYPQLAVPENPPSLITLDLERSMGSITAKLWNGTSNMALTEDDRWGVDVTEIASGRMIISRTSCMGSHLELEGLPEGEFRLSIVSADYERFDSDSFCLPAEGPFQLGDITLHPRE
jgi:hypothetical protein